MKKPTRSRKSITINDRQFPVHVLSRRAPIDTSRFIPVIPAAGRAAGPVQLVRRADLLPKSAPAAVAADFHNFGDQLIDVFDPRYGSHYPRSARFSFIFSFSRVTWTNAAPYNGWRMSLEYGKPGYQRLSFTVVQGTGGNYLRVPLFNNNGAGSAGGAILRVRAHLTDILLDLSGRAYKFFDLILIGNGNTVEFSLSTEFNPNTICLLDILQVELYQSIRVFPTEIFEA